MVIRPIIPGHTPGHGAGKVFCSRPQPRPNLTPGRLLLNTVVPDSKQNITGSLISDHHMAQLFPFNHAVISTLWIFIEARKHKSSRFLELLDQYQN